MNYRMQIQYDGARYRGWQRQAATGDTIQGKLEAILSKRFAKNIEIDGASRTDSGVHALAQIANFHIHDEEAVDPTELKDYLNQYLPEDIAVSSVVTAGERFHSRLNATGKTYQYNLLPVDTYNVFSRKYAWQMTEPLDIDSMREAAQYVLGKHDFRSFCTKAAKKKTTVRTIRSLEIFEKKEKVVIEITGNGFLYNMVRILVGTLVEVGTGRRKPQEIPGILEKKERRYAGETAPACGLFLKQIYYE
ncbi:MAG: tRNA pseudouridine(38-40) synthase TruA [Eubacterium sp.]